MENKNVEKKIKPKIQYVNTTFYSYAWHMDDDEIYRTIIWIYGLNTKNQNVAVKIVEFTPYVYVELPENIDWKDDSYVALLVAKLDALVGEENRPLIKMRMWKKRLYYASFENGKRKEFPYLFCSFSSVNDLDLFRRKLFRPVYIGGLGNLTLKIHENNASPILQFTSIRKLNLTGWNRIIGKPILGDSKETFCDFEYVVNWKNISPEEGCTLVARPLLLSFDLEVNSSIPTSMPNANRPDDKVFQISCIFGRQGSSPDTWEKYILTLGETEEKILNKGIIPLHFKSEDELVCGFTKLVQEKQPNIMMGYNIFCFDIPYMIQRAELGYYIYEFDQLGMRKNKHSKKKTINWSSSAFKNQHFEFLDAEGRLFIDLLPLVRRDHKLSSYKLESIATHFLKNIIKDPLGHKGIFKCYRLGMKGGAIGRKAMTICGNYCVGDSIVVINLFETLKYWTGLGTFSKVVGLPIFALYTQGQQIKVFAGVYKKCTHENIVVERDVCKAQDSDYYVGATVLDPEVGVHDKLVSLDFCLDGETLVSMSNGLSVRLKNLDITHDVVSFDEKTNGLKNFETTGILQRKGIRETVKIFLQDGTEIVSTPDHKFMLDDGSWCRADELKDKYVRCGVEYPEDVRGKDEEKWFLEAGSYSFNMTTEENRNKALAFSRMVGFILSDGCVYTSGRDRDCAEVYLGTEIDAQNFMTDLKKFTAPPTIRKRGGKQKGTTYSISFPSDLAKVIHALEDMVVGKRATQPMKLPAFLFEEGCPKSVVREFLGGLFGGDGSAPYICGKTGKYGSVSFKWTTIEKYKNDMLIVFEKIKYLLELLEIPSVIQDPIKIKYRNDSSLVPKDILENPRWDYVVSIPQEYILPFQNNIGFRYCINKTLKLNVIASYQKMQQKTREQHKKVINFVFDIPVNRNTRERLNLAREEVFKNEPPINIYSLSSISDIHYQRYETVRHADRPRQLSLQKKKFPTAVDYVKETQTEKWFKIDGHKKVYAVSSDDVSIPVWRRRVIDVREYKNTEVYDIEVPISNNFISAGVVAHNCSLYPSMIIAYNLCWSTLVNDDKVPDKLCHILEWHDHIGCEHDPSIVRKNELISILKKEETTIKELRNQRDDKKNKDRKEEFKLLIAEKIKSLKPVRDEKNLLTKGKKKVIICEKRKYRFLKSPIGVLPEILKNLLDGRKVAKNERDEVGKQLKEEKNPEKKLDLMSLYDVLDKQQEALKVSSNSGYGITGARKGMLTCMPVAMCTTYLGRISIEKATREIHDKYKGHVIYGDSVSGDTPVLLRKGKTLYYKRFDELEEFMNINWGYGSQSEEDDVCDKNIYEQKDNEFEVWSDKGFTKIKKVIRHKTQKEMFRILTKQGFVTVTEDHSLLDTQGNEIKPSDVKVGFPLLHYPLPVSFNSRKKYKGKPLSNDLLNCSLKHLNDFFIRYCDSLGRSDNFIFENYTEASILFFILERLGYKAVINLFDNGNVMISKGASIHPESDDNNIFLILSLGKVDDYVYDFETENHHFSAGIGRMIVHNTDSNYVAFPHLKTIKESWDYATMVAENVSKLFPSPMKIAFENKVYARYFVLTKKRYMSLECDRDGNFKTKKGSKELDISKKGVLLQRRDNSEFVRHVYGEVIMKIFNKEEKYNIINFILDELNKLCSRFYKYEDFIITKSIGDIGRNDEGDLEPVEGKNEKTNKPCWKLGDYTLRKLLPKDAKARQKELDLKDAKDENEYYLLSLPAQAQLAEKMKARGQLVSAGSRIEYIITTTGGHNAKQYIKIEDSEYFMKHSSSLTVDYHYYLKQLTNPLDQVLDAVYGKDKGYVKGFMMQQYKYRTITRENVIKSLKKLFAPKIVVKN